MTDSASSPGSNHPLAPSVRAVSFDAAGTLIHLAEPVGTTYAKVAARHGFGADPRMLGDAFARLWKQFPPPFSADGSESSENPGNSVNDPDERSWWRRFVFGVFRECGTSGIDDAEAFDCFFDALYQHYESPGTWYADPEAAETLSRLNGRLPCLLLSNFDARLRRILADLDLLEPFERVYLSCELRLSKPDPRVFARVASDLSLAPSEILHVGDDPRCDWQGAADAGFQVFRAGHRGRPLSALIEELSLA